MQFLLQLLPFILIFVVFWFFLIRPQKKKQQEHDEMLNNLSIGDNIVTIGGIKAKIIKIKDDSVRLRISSNVDIDVMKNAISRLDKSEEKKEKEDEE
ncbi:MAG: preprotein translocase subunit YajC [Halanaerobiales bacterium]